MRPASEILKTILLVAFLLLPRVSGAQTCNTFIEATAPEARFTLSGDGTATDRSTGLVWTRCSLGQKWDGETCRGEASSFPWGGALREAVRFEFAGYADWRLPNKNELETIVEKSCSSPAVNSRAFPATPPGYFWTSSPYIGLPNGAWSVDFGYGSVTGSIKSGGLHVRLVRDGRHNQ